MDEEKIVYRRRTSWDLMANILTECLEPRKKTAIVYGVVTSFEVIEKYLDLMITKGLLEVKRDNLFVVYETTQKGRRVLELYEKMSSILKNIVKFI